jgi:hypothetical protein
LRVFENRVLRVMLGPKREEVAGGWRRQHNEEYLIRFRDIIWAINSRRMRWAGNVARMSKFVPVLLTEHHAKKAYWSGGIAPRIL